MNWLYKGISFSYNNRAKKVKVISETMNNTKKINTFFFFLLVIQRAKRNNTVLSWTKIGVRDIMIILKKKKNHVLVLLFLFGHNSD